MKIIFLILLLAGCSHQPQTPKFKGLELEAFTHYRAKNAGDILRNTSAATIAIWLKGPIPKSFTAGILNISVGGNHLAWKTRAGIHVFNTGAFQVVARAGDHEELSEAVTDARLMREGEWIHVAATIDYTARKILIYIDGVPVKEARATYNFSQATTSDTWSQHVTLGAEDDGHTSYFHGELTGAFAEKRILSEQEIQELRNKTRP